MSLDQVAQAVERQLSSTKRKVSAQELRRTGPLVDVAIHAECPPGDPCPPAVGKGLIDTGADRTAVEFSSLPETAKLDGMYYAQGVTSDVVPLPVYPLKLTFPGTTLDAVKLDRVAATPHLGKQGLVALIGRDVLSQAQLAYDGPSGSYRLETPRGEAHVTSPSSGPLLFASIAAAIGAAAGAATALLLAQGEPKTAGGPGSIADAAVLPVGVGVVVAALALLVSTSIREGKQARASTRPALNSMSGDEAFEYVYRMLLEDEKQQNQAEAAPPGEELPAAQRALIFETRSRAGRQGVRKKS